MGIALGLASDVPLFLAPSPELAQRSAFQLEGESLLAAVAVTAEAWRRGVQVPANVVVSAAVAIEGGEAILRPVNDCDRKRELLETELPGCHFYFLSSDPVQDSTIVKLHPLKSGKGSLKALFDQILGAGEPRTQNDVAILWRKANDHYSDQRYAEAQRLYEDILSTGAQGRTRFVALVRLGAIALHQGRGQDTEKRFAEAQREQSDELSRQDIAEQQFLEAQRLVDAFRPGVAGQVLKGPLEYWSSKLERIGEPVENRMLLIGFLGAARLLHLLNGDLEKALDAQREVLTWAPKTELARCYGDLCDVLRRLHRIEEADEAISRAFDFLPDMPIASYRRNTEAFLHYHRARLLLLTGRPVPARERLEDLRSQLPAEEAVAWRLSQTSSLLAVRDGNASAIEVAADQVRNEARPFRRWYEAIGLIQSSREAWAPGPLFRSVAADALGTLAEYVKDHPVLDSARARFVAAARDGRVDVGAEKDLVRYAAY
jgi:tetratricopeptide (TPR) repeat protein